jgi:hypothetical protein
MLKWKGEIFLCYATFMESNRKKALKTVHESKNKVGETLIAWGS